MGNKTSYEAFKASYTGQLGKLGLGNGKVYTFKPMFRVQKNQTYIIAYTAETRLARLLTLVIPEVV